jgi:hypothetical protein
MAWETRKRGNRYYTRSIRCGNRIIRQYIGAGEDGLKAAAEDEEQRAERQAQRQALADHKQNWNAIDDTVAQLDNECRKLVYAGFVSAGYRCHKRGEWRKKREKR